MTRFAVTPGYPEVALGPGIPVCPARMFTLVLVVAGLDMRSPYLPRYRTYGVDAFKIFMQG